MDNNELIPRVRNLIKAIDPFFHNDADTKAFKSFLSMYGYNADAVVDEMEAIRGMLNMIIVAERTKLMDFTSSLNKIVRTDTYLLAALFGMNLTRARDIQEQCGFLLDTLTTGKDEQEQGGEDVS